MRCSCIPTRMAAVSRVRVLVVTCGHSAPTDGTVRVVQQLSPGPLVSAHIYIRSAAERGPASKVEKNVEMNTLASALRGVNMHNFRSNGDKEVVCAMMRVLSRYPCHPKALNLPLRGRSDYSLSGGNSNPVELQCRPMQRLSLIPL